MLRRLLPLFVLAAIGSAAPQTAVHESNHAAGFQSDKSSANSEPQKEQERQPTDLRLEHADVPMYPQLARTARIFGTVQVQVTVKEGKVAKTEVKSGPPVLASAAVEEYPNLAFLSPCQCDVHYQVHLSARNERGVRPAEPESGVATAVAREDHRRPGDVG